jgi:general secretion pathway protein K
MNLSTIPQCNFRQRGVALLVALLVVALATVLIAGLLDRGELTAARTRNQLRTAQAQAYAQGLEAYAAKVLRQDQEADSGSIDTADDIWAVPLPPTPVPGGEITATMSDLNGRFNLNNLDPAPANVNADIWKRKFVLLLLALKLDTALADNVVAWMNPDPAASADDNWYLSQPLPYSPAKREFIHVSELRLVKGVDGDTYARLAPYVSALPPGTPINVNTARVLVLMTLNESMTEQMAQSLWQQGHAHYQNFPQDLTANVPGLVVDCGGHPLAQCYGVRSSYFLARGEITLDDLPFTFYSLIERRSNSANGGIRVIQRSRGVDD